MPGEFYPYRPCVGIALFNKDGKVFVGERIDTPGSWQMPQGGIDAGEDITTAAFRELGEEIGTDKADIIEVRGDTILYDIPADVLARLHKIWDKPYIGQEQTWVAMRFTGTDADINLTAHEPAEFSQWKWEELARVPELIVPFKRTVYEQVIASFKKYAQ